MGHVNIIAQEGFQEANLEIPFLKWLTGAHKVRGYAISLSDPEHRQSLTEKIRVFFAPSEQGFFEYALEKETGVPVREFAIVTSKVTDDEKRELDALLTASPGLAAKYQALSRINDLRNNQAAAETITRLARDSPLVVYLTGPGYLVGLKRVLGTNGLRASIEAYAQNPGIQHVSGDALDTMAQVLAHGVAVGNLENMATGIARQINERWPKSYSRFKKIRREGFRPGEVIMDYENIPVIAYAGTQPDLMHAEPSMVNAALRNLRKRVEADGFISVAMPRIGAGYGKLGWEDVLPIVQNTLAGARFRTLVYRLPNQPG